MMMKRETRMKIEVAKQERMSETGSSLIRLIQNNEMPVIDLMVREAVQNSLDAAISGNGYVQVDFAIRSFEREKLAMYFEGIEDQLTRYYPDKYYNLLEIRDSNTHGLTGPIHDADCDSSDFGNLIKLIYQVGMPQQKEGSGGSWGLGKTVYFRLGIGIVIYYSRIEVNGEYVSRLAACLVEDETRKETLLGRRRNHRGIAWWGQIASGTSTKPLTDESEIEQILKCLGVVLYTGAETGTNIIIPFLRDDLRAEEASIDLDDQEQKPKAIITPWWNTTDTDYISVALQRWYAPRLMNPKYSHGRWLRATVNGEGITRERFLPVFSIIQDLYNETLNVTADDNIGLNDDNIKKIKCVPIKLNSTFKNTSVAGWLAFTRVSSNELLMSHPNNQPSPWVQVYGRDISFDYNPALITYTRKPGMLVGYEHVGNWVNNIPKSDPDEYVIGIFVANSNNPMMELHPRKIENEFLLEEYIRGCEKADHTTWADWIPNKKKHMIIERIQKYVGRTISNTFSEKASSQPAKKDATLGRLLADVLLPPEGFGRISTVQSGGGGKVGTSSAASRHARFNKLSNPMYANNLVRFDFELFGGKQTNAFDIKIKVLSESGDIDADAWEAEEGIGGKFPISISKCIIESVETHQNKKTKMACNLLLDGTVKTERFDDMSMSIQKSNRYQQVSGIEFRNAIGKTIKGSIWIASEDRNVRAVFYIDSHVGGTSV